MFITNQGMMHILLLLCRPIRSRVLTTSSMVMIGRRMVREEVVARMMRSI